MEQYAVERGLRGLVNSSQFTVIEIVSDASKALISLFCKC